MNLRFKPNDKAFYNNKEVTIKKSIFNASINKLKYELESGEIVLDVELNKYPTVVLDNKKSNEISKIFNHATKEGVNVINNLTESIAEVAEKSKGIQVVEQKHKSKKKNYLGDNIGK